MFQVLFSWYVVLTTKEKATSHNRQKVAEMRKMEPSGMLLVVTVTTFINGNMKSVLQTEGNCPQKQISKH